MSGGDWARLVLLSTLWGGTYFFVAVAVPYLPPVTLVFLRLATAALALGVVLRLRRAGLPRGGALWRAIFVMAAIAVLLPFVLIVWGQGRIGAGLAAVLNATTPLWGVLAAHLFTGDEKATPARILGVLLGFGGVAVMVGGDALAGPEGQIAGQIAGQAAGQAADRIAGQIACLVAAMFYALGAVYGRRFARLGAAPLPVAFGQVVAAGLIALPIMLALERPLSLPVPPPAAIAAVLAIGLLSTALGFVIYFRLLASAGAVGVSLVTFLIPVTAILLGTLVLGERLEPRQIAGMALIAAGLVSIDGRLARRLRPPGG